MIHDQTLVDQLSELPVGRFEREVFRATGISKDPTAASTSGGRWAPPPDGDPGIYVLYTCLERDGALAEVCSFLAALTPIPKARPIKVTRLGVSTARTVRLDRTTLSRFGVAMDRFGERDYARTQEIGAALAFLGCDGLIAPSARWPCDNLMIFADNHILTERLEEIDYQEIEWRSWAIEHRLITE